MLTRLWQRIGEALSYTRKGDLEITEVKAEGDRVKVVINLGDINSMFTMRLTPESAWLFGNKLVDEAHTASNQRAGDPA